MEDLMFEIAMLAESHKYLNDKIKRYIDFITKSISDIENKESIYILNSNDNTLDYMFCGVRLYLRYYTYDCCGMFEYGLITENGLEVNFQKCASFKISDTGAILKEGTKVSGPQSVVNFHWKQTVKMYKEFIAELK